MLCILLIPVYVNSFDIWHWLDQTIPGGRARYIPIILFGLILFLSLFRWRAIFRSTTNLMVIALGVALAICAFLLADARYPAKRIHVPEYVVLAFVAREAFRWRLSGFALTLAAGLAAVILGVHDELLQGLHPDRYFGYSDLIVNTVSACAGALIGQALATNRSDDTMATCPGPVGLALSWMCFSVALMLLAMLVEGPNLPPVWALAPALSIPLVSFLVMMRDESLERWRFATVVIGVFSFSCVLEPMWSYGVGADFR